MTLTLDRRPRIVGLEVDEQRLTVQLDDGRTLAVPLDWFPRLAHATPEERGRWELGGTGSGIHWPDLDEDLHIEGLLAGRRSGESERSLRRWLDSRGKH